MGGMEVLVLMLYVPDMLPMVSNEPENDCFKATKSWAVVVNGVGISVTLSLGDLSVDLGFMEVSSLLAQAWCRARIAVPTAGSG